MQRVGKTIQVSITKTYVHTFLQKHLAFFSGNFGKKNAMNPGIQNPKQNPRDPRKYSDPSTWVVHPQIQDGLKLPATSRVARAGMDGGWTEIKPEPKEGQTSNQKQRSFGVPGVNIYIYVYVYTYMYIYHVHKYPYYHLCLGYIYIYRYWWESKVPPPPTMPLKPRVWKKRLFRGQPGHWFGLLSWNWAALGGIPLDLHGMEMAQNPHCLIPKIRPFVSVGLTKEPTEKKLVPSIVDVETFI